MSQYSDMTTPELLAALETAGRLPNLDLIRGVLERPAELTPTLLEWLAGVLEDSFPQEDGRNYRGIHVGLLLIAYKEPAALPIFDRVLRQDEEGEMVEWFIPDLAGYGPALLPWAAAFLADPAVLAYAKPMVVEVLGVMAWHFPEARDRTMAVLQAQLPPLDDDGQPIMPDGYGQPNYAWTWAALELAQLHDASSRAQIVALYQHDLMDEWVMGDVDEYLSLLDSDETPPFDQPLDILETYKTLRRLDNSHVPMSTLKSRASAGSLDIYSPLDVEPRPAALWEDLPSTTYVRPEPKVGRNDPCPCGSGKKYKKCHGKNA